MSTQKNTRFDELSTNVEENQSNKSYPLVDVEKIEGTPFHIASDENGHIIALGKYRLTEILESKELALEMIRNNDWQLTMNLIALITNLEVSNALENKMKEIDSEIEQLEQVEN